MGVMGQVFNRYSALAAETPPLSSTLPTVQHRIYLQASPLLDETTNTSSTYANSKTPRLL
jgi:hypothetical protein